MSEYEPTPEDIATTDRVLTWTSEHMRSITHQQHIAHAKRSVAGCFQALLAHRQGLNR